MQTEFEFTLPRGFLDADGRVHRNGVMRLATAADEIECLQDARVQTNEAYLPVLLLSRVISRLGDLERVTPITISSLFASDLSYLEDMYMRLNSAHPVYVGAVCPHCSGAFQLQVAPVSA